MLVFISHKKLIILICYQQLIYFCSLKFTHTLSAKSQYILFFFWSWEEGYLTIVRLYSLEPRYTYVRDGQILLD